MQDNRTLRYRATVVHKHAKKSVADAAAAAAAATTTPHLPERGPRISSRRHHSTAIFQSMSIMMMKTEQAEGWTCVGAMLGHNRYLHA